MRRHQGFKPRRLPSAAALELMDGALASFQKVVADTGSRHVPPISWDEVRGACLAIENSLAARGLLRNTRRLSRLFAGLEHYRKSIDVLCNGTEYLCWIWSPITVVLQMASDCVKAFEVIMKAYTKIGDTLSRFQVLQETFFDDPRLQQLLAVFYVDILRLHGLAYQFAQRSSWEVFLLTTCGRFERRFGNIIENLERHADLIDKEGNVLNISETQKLLQKLLAQQQENLHQIEAEEKQDSARQYVDVLSRLQIEERDQLAIFEAHAEGLQYSGTCTWAIQQEEIASWLDEKGRVQRLWLQGSAGKGKSVLSTHLITFLKASGNRRVIYHFCTDQYSDSKRYEQVLRSIIRQLLQMNEESIAHAYRAFLEERRPSSLPEIERLVGELLVIVCDTQVDGGPVWIVVDGVDECEVDKLPRLVNILKGKARARGRNGQAPRKSSTCKVLLTSRRGPGFEKGFSGICVVALGTEGIKEKVNAAIASYAASRLQSSRNSHRLHQLGINAEELEEIKIAIVGKADGMFLYARLILDFLANQLFINKNELKKRVSQLPKTLKEFYSKLLGSMISYMDNESREIVKTIFRWVAFAKRPLRKVECLSAVTFSVSGLDACTLVPGYFLEDCVNFIEVKHDNTISFIHSSVKEFLIHSMPGFAITEAEAIEEQAIASAVCLASASRCLHSHADKHAGMLRVIKGLYGLITYSSQHWVDYVLCMAESHGKYPQNFQRYFTMVESFIEELERPDWRADMSHYNLDLGGDSMDDRVTLLRLYPHLQHHIRLAVACRSQDGQQSSIARSDGVDSPATTRKKAFDAASRILEKYQETARWLLQQDYYEDALAEDLETFKAEFRNSIFTCRLRSCPRARDGFENEQLLKEHEWAHSTLPRCTFSQCRYPPFANNKALRFHIEKYHAPKSTIRPLRRVPDLQKAWDGSSIGWTTRQGEAAPGATGGRDPQRSSGGFHGLRTATADSTHSPAKMLEMAPHEGDLDAHGQTYLARACAKGEYDIAKQRLQERPEDLNIADYLGNTPLQIAAINGSEDIVKLLIEAGCNLDCINYDKNTPLLDAVDNGHLGVVKILLDAGVNPRKANVYGEEPMDRISDDLDNANEIRVALKEAHILIDSKVFQERISHVTSYWKSDQRSKECVFNGVSSIVIIMGKNRESQYFYKNNAVHVWLLGYEFPSTLMLFTLDTLYILTRAKKAKYLERLKGGRFPLEVLVRGKDAGANEKLWETITTKIKEAGPKVGVIANDTSHGSFVNEWKKVFAEQCKGITEVDIRQSISTVFLSTKDKAELEAIRMSSKACVALMTPYFLEKMSSVVDQEEKVQHSALAHKVDRKLDDKSFWKIVELPNNTKLPAELDPSLLDWVTGPIIQSGGKYDLRLASEVNDDILHPGTIIAAMGLRYGLYCSTIARTFLIDPNKWQDTNYKLLCNVHNAVLEEIRDGVTAKDVYAKALSIIMAKKPEMKKHFLRNVGWGIGLETQDSTLVLNAKNTWTLKDGMTLCISTGFQDIENMRPRDEQSKIYSLLIVDTILVTKTNPIVFTVEAPIDLESNSFFIIDE